MRRSPNEDLRILKTREVIHKTFGDMLCEMDYEKITVKELTERARINRKTFYLHYPTLDDLLAELQDELADEFIRRTSRYSVILDMPNITQEFFLQSQALDKLRQRISASRGANKIHGSNRIMEKIIEQNHRCVDSMGEMDSATRNIIMAFLASASVAMYQQWLTDWKKISMEGAIALSSSLMCKGVFGVNEEMKKGNNP
jgi:AcrR family transcriptional regulator